MLGRWDAALFTYAAAASHPSPAAPAAHWRESSVEQCSFGFAAHRHTPLLFEGTAVQRGAICIHKSHASSSFVFSLAPNVLHSIHSLAL